MRNKLEIIDRIQLLQKRVDTLAKAKEDDMAYLTEDVAIKERIKLLKWVLGEERYDDIR